MSKIKILPFEVKHTKSFEVINREWIEEYIGMTSEDERILADPQSEIINQGGTIFLAEYEGDIVGTICLLKTPKGFIIAKLGVLKLYRGKGIGKLLCEAMIELARNRGIENLHLETSQKLESAIALYKRLQFEEINTDQRSARCDIQMSLKL